MKKEIQEVNVVRLVGKVVSERVFSHEIYGEGFYTINLEISRLSDSTDLLTIMVSERLLINRDLIIGDYLLIKGQLRSYNRYINNRNRLILTIFAKDIFFLEEKDLEEYLKKPNEIFLDGYICKKPVYRKTPFGREITDILVAVNRAYNKSDYIPSITWGRNARFAENMEIGDHVKLWGRIQSREYNKRLDDGGEVIKLAVEVSVSKLEYLKTENNRLEDMEPDL